MRMILPFSPPPSEVPPLNHFDNSFPTAKRSDRAVQVQQTLNQPIIRLQGLGLRNRAGSIWPLLSCMLIYVY